MATPARGMRTVPFGLDPHYPHADLDGTNRPRPSPFTPSSAARAGTRKEGGNQRAFAFSSQRPHPNRDSDGRSNPSSSNGEVLQLSTRPESAEVFVNGGVEEALCNGSLDVVSIDSMAAHDVALAMASVVESQLEYGNEFLSDRATHPFVQNEVREVMTVLDIERDTWALLDRAWRSPAIRCQDAISRRANLDYVDRPDLPGVDVCRRALEWLESLSANALDKDGGPRLKPLDDPAYRWDYTKQNLQSAPCVDFPLLPNAIPLEETESKAELRISREVFRLVRAGRLEDAESVCREVGQSWRAAILAGGRNASEMSAMGVKGGARLTWRRAAAVLADSPNPSIPAHERALCALFCGQLSPVLAVADSFEDRVWARLWRHMDQITERAVQRSESERSDGELAQKMESAMEISGGDCDMSPASSSDEDVSIDDIIGAFHESDGSREGPPGAHPAVFERVRRVRSYAVLGRSTRPQDAAALASELAALGRAGLEHNTPWVCRFAANIAVFMKRSGLLERAGSESAVFFEECIVGYARMLIQREVESEASMRSVNEYPPVHPHVYNIVARYLSELENTDLMVDVYADLLACALRGDLQEKSIIERQSLTSSEQVEERRRLCMKRAGKYMGRHGRRVLHNLVVAAVDRVWAEHLIGMPSAISLSNEARGGEARESVAGVNADFDAVSPDDECVVQAISFLINPNFSNYPESLRRVLKAARRFFLTGKRTAARHVIVWYPREAMSEIQDADDCDAEFREFYCWKTYMDALDKYDDWRVHAQSRPVPLSDEIFREARMAPGEVDYRVQTAARLRVEEYEQIKADYQAGLQGKLMRAAHALHSALLCDDGWMRAVGRDSSSGNPVEEQRAREIQAVRQIAVPQMAVLLHGMYYDSQSYVEALQVACLVASEEWRLYEDFDQSELRAFLKRVARSAVFAANGSVRRGGAKPPYTGTFWEEANVASSAAT